MTGRDEVDRLLDVITVDCYNLAEQMMAFYETFVEAVPHPTTVVGATTRVLGIDIAEHGEALTARCQRGDVVQDLRLSEMVFPPGGRLDPRGLPPLPRPDGAPGSRSSRVEAILSVR